ncbi:uncharacterized protein C3orf20-like [Aplochiton taeniatus]
MAEEVEKLEELSPPWREGGCAARELRRLQHRIWNTVDDWLELYRTATGIKCPDVERMPIGPSRSRSKKEVHSLMFPRRIAPQAPAMAAFPTSSTSGPSSPCPALLRAALLGEDARRLCRCSSRTMPLVTDVEYNAFVARQPAHSEQILVVCVSAQRQPLRSHSHSTEDALEQLYERRNRNRTMPCTQCQLDSFRLVRYEMSTATTCSGPPSTLLLQRHNAAPGMFLMYIRGRLLFADFIFNGYSSSVRDLHKQICKTRGDYRQGHSLPPDYKFRHTEATVGPQTKADSATEAWSNVCL